jgi:hypothetical protein
MCICIKIYVFVYKYTYVLYKNICICINNLLALDELLTLLITNINNYNAN